VTINDLYPPVMPQDPIVELLPDLYLVRGSIHVAPGLPISKNMVVIRQGGELTLVGSVRMPPENEADLEALGKVTRLIRIGIHGVDDAYTVNRFKCQLWCLKDTENYHALPRPDELFDEGDPFPIQDTEVIRFQGMSVSEAALLWKRHGGVLITSDGLQHYGDWRYFSSFSKVAHRIMGFGAGTIVGPMWHRFMCKDDAVARGTFEEILRREFTHAVGLHGSFVKDNAHQAIEDAVKREFDEGPAMPEWVCKLGGEKFDALLAPFRIR